MAWNIYLMLMWAPKARAKIFWDMRIGRLTADMYQIFKEKIIN